MKAAALAMVLILGAAVVLWYGNTLNLFVLSGLIGGLAALLLSLPITLIIFAFLSKRHVMQLEAEAREENARIYPYHNVSVEEDEEEDAGYPYSPVSTQYEDEYRSRPIALPARHLPVPTSTRLPVSRRQSVHLYPGENAPYPSSAPSYASGPLPAQQQFNVAPNPNTRNLPERRSPAGRKIYYPGLTGYQAHTRQSQHQSAALRAAQQEAAYQQSRELEYYPYSASQRLPAFSTEQRLLEQRPRPTSLRQSQQLPAQPTNNYRPRRTVEGTSLPPISTRRSLPPAGESSASQSYAPSYRPRDPQTDPLAGRYPQTNPLRQQPSSGQLTRNPHIEAQRRNPDVISGTLKNPMQRRAPYMYEDDSLRQELAQHITAPIVRRSSRYTEYDEDEE